MQCDGAPIGDQPATVHSLMHAKALVFNHDGSFLESFGRHCLAKHAEHTTSVIMHASMQVVMAVCCSPVQLFFLDQHMCAGMGVRAASVGAAVVASWTALGQAALPAAAAASAAACRCSRSTCTPSRACRCGSGCRLSAWLDAMRDTCLCRVVAIELLRVSTL